MTQAEKKMKRYVNAIERRLNLPLEVKARVMSDFGSSISARREAGQTDEEIYAELGDPKKVAAELNEQMQEFAYRKSPWRFVFAVFGIYFGIKLLGIVYVLIFSAAMAIYAKMPNMASSVGVIGGADGPTAIFVTTSTNWLTFLLEVGLTAAVVGLCIWGYRRLCECRKK